MSPELLSIALTFCVGIIGFFLRDMWQNKQQKNLAEAINKLNLNVAILTEKIEGLSKEFVSIKEHNEMLSRVVRLEEQIKECR